jgi:hypothetical protein
MGLGEVSVSLPPHYLVPLNRLEIDAYINLQQALWKQSPLATGCTKIWGWDWDGSFVPCFHVMREIERGNLYYVNGIVTYEQLIGVYNESKKFMETIPYSPSLKEQLKNSANFVIGAVGGFLTMGPVGIFVGGASATSKIIADARRAAASRATTLLDPMIKKAQEAAAERQKEDLTKYALIGGGVIITGGIIYWMLS